MTGVWSRCNHFFFLSCFAYTIIIKQTLGNIKMIINWVWHVFFAIMLPIDDVECCLQGVRTSETDSVSIITLNPTFCKWNFRNNFVERYICLLIWISLKFITNYCDVIIGEVASQITSLTIVYSTVYSYTDQRKHQSSASLAFVRGIHRGPVNSPHKWPVTRKIVQFDDVIM